MSRTRSPTRGRRGRGRDEREGAGERGQRLVNGRPRKTQEELDREMEDYWGAKGEENGGVGKEEAAAVEGDEDIDMIT